MHLVIYVWQGRILQSWSLHMLKVNIATPCL